MIQRLRKRFIRIAMLSVALVLLALTLIVNIANFVSTNRDINEMLDLIYEGPDPGTPAEKPQTGPETGRPYAAAGAAEGAVQSGNAVFYALFYPDA